MFSYIAMAAFAHSRFCFFFLINTSYLGNYSLFFFFKSNPENFILTQHDSTQQIYEALEEYLRYNFCPGVSFSFGVSREVLKDSFPF